MNDPNHPNRKTVSGRAGSRKICSSKFTLIELLIVISILAVLGGMLLPALAKAREKARLISCLNNQKQCALSLLQYTDDNGGWISPVRDVGAAGKFWHAVPAMYSNYINDYAAYQNEDEKITRGLRSILRCPADITRFGSKALPNYGMNAYEPLRTSGNYISLEHRKITNVKHVSQVMMIGDSYRNLWDTEISAGGPNLAYRFHPSNSIGAVLYWRKYARHIGTTSSNVAMCDGSAKNIKYSTFQFLMHKWEDPFIDLNQKN